LGCFSFDTIFDTAFYSQ